MPEAGVKYSKPFDKDEEDSASLGDMSFYKPRNQSKLVKILAAVVVVLVILLIIFLALFAHERSRYKDCKGSTQVSQG